jgi:hypothetical protein
MIMDLRIQIQNLDRQLQNAKKQAQFAQINCQVLGTTLHKTREGLKAILLTLEGQPEPKPDIIDAIAVAKGILELNPNEIANVIIQQGIALAQLRALVAQQQTKLDQLEAAAIPPAEDVPETPKE